MSEHDTNATASLKGPICQDCKWPLDSEEVRRCDCGTGRASRGRSHQPASPPDGPKDIGEVVLQKLELAHQMAKTGTGICAHCDGPVLKIGNGWIHVPNSPGDFWDHEARPAGEPRPVFDPTPRKCPHCGHLGVPDQECSHDTCRNCGLDVDEPPTVQPFGHCSGCGVSFTEAGGLPGNLCVRCARQPYWIKAVEVGPPGTDMRTVRPGERIAAGDTVFLAGSYQGVLPYLVGQEVSADSLDPIFRGVPLGEPEGPAGVDGIAGPSCPDGVPGEPTGRTNSFFGPPGATGTVGCSCAGAAGSDEPAVPTGMKCVVCGIDCADAPRGFVRGAPKGVVPALWQCPEHLAASKNDELAAFATLRTELAGAAVAVHVGTVEQEPGEASGNYRILEPGEVIQAGDEYRISAGGKWYAVEPGSQMAGQKAPFTVVFRRAVQGGVGLYESAQMAAAGHDNAGCMAIDPAPWWVRLGRRLFPRAWVESPEMDGAHDVLHVSVVAYFDFFDRLRILISGRVMIESRVATENKVGRSKASSVVCALPPGILEDKV